MRATIKLYFGLLFIFSFDIWINNSEVAKKFFGDWLKPLDDHKIPFIWTLLLFVGLFIYHRDVIEKKERKKIELENLNKSRMEMLVMANQQLSAYRIRDILLELFRKFVALHPYVLGVQLYDYTMKHQNGKSSVKLSLIDGYIREMIDANAAQQIYYTFDIKVYREFQQAYQLLYTPESNIVMEDLEEEKVNPTPLIKFIQKYNNHLSQKILQEINQDDAILYAFVVLGIEILERAVGEPIEYNLDPDIIKQLQSKKRTGFLEAILLGDSPYTFSHNGKNEKADRQYIASSFHVNDDQQYLYMILLDAGILSEVNHMELLGNIADDFEVKLQNCFKTVYNGEIGE